jgi:hypothetical protein
LVDVLGKTIPSYRVALESEIQRWKMFAVALREDDREVFYQLMDICRNYASAASCAVRPVIFDAMSMSMALDQQKTLNQLQRMLNELQVKKENECIKVDYDLVIKAKTAIEDLNLPFLSLEDFVQQQLKSLIEQHEEWKQRH